MSELNANNKRIAKNTLFLYIRMLFTMGVSLYTSRVVLQTLGVEDYGIYNVVGGVIAMLSFLRGSLSGASSRYITYELGKGSDGNLKKMFATILCIHVILAILTFFVGETLGLWFVYNKLVIPTERFTAALWVYHCAILTSIISILSVPYNSLLIAYEKMDAFAYISIAEVILKFAIVWLLVFLPCDKLIIYAILYLIVQCVIRMIYNHYCTKHFIESRTVPEYHPKQMKEIFIYAGWTLNGTLAVVGYTQGINILLNIFFGPIVNAAHGIATQVEGATNVFVQNFQMATRPQIIKSYASNKLEYMHNLIIASSKFGFYLMLIITFPILLCVDSILKLWLGTVPDHTVNFVYIILFTGLLSPYKNALLQGIHATGDIRKFQLYEGTSLLMVLPVSYVFLKLRHISPEMVMIIYLCIALITQGIRVWIVLPKIKMKFIEYLKKVIFPSLFPLLAMIIPLCCVNLRKNMTFYNIVIYVGCAVIYMLVITFLTGLNRNERLYIIQNLIKKK